MPQKPPVPPPSHLNATGRQPAAHVLKALASPLQAKKQEPGAGSRQPASHVLSALGQGAQARFGPAAAARASLAPHVQTAVAPAKTVASVTVPSLKAAAAAAQARPLPGARQALPAQPIRQLPAVMQAKLPERPGSVVSRQLSASVVQRASRGESKEEKSASGSGAESEGPWERDAPILSYLRGQTPEVNARLDHETAASGNAEYFYDTDKTAEGWSSEFGFLYAAKTGSHGNTSGRVNPGVAAAIKASWPKLIGHPEQKILNDLQREVLRAFGRHGNKYRSVTLHLYSTQGLCPACKKALHLTRKAIRDARVPLDVKIYYGHHNAGSNYGWGGDSKLSGNYFHYFVN